MTDQPPLKTIVDEIHELMLADLEHNKVFDAPTLKRIAEMVANDKLGEERAIRKAITPEREEPQS